MRLALLAMAIFGSNAGAEEKFQKLTAGQICARFAGMDLTDNVHWRDLYQQNGAMTSTSMGRKRTRKWRVEENQLCIEFEKEPVPKCYDEWISGSGRAPARGIVAVAGRTRACGRAQLMRT